MVTICIFIQTNVKRTLSGNIEFYVGSTYMISLYLHFDQAMGHNFSTKIKSTT